MTDVDSQHGADAFRQYIEQYGRDSGRRDLLTKILSAKPDTGVRPLTDLEVSLEIGNLVFAGTGKSRDAENGRRSDGACCRHDQHHLDLSLLGAFSTARLAETASR